MKHWPKASTVFFKTDFRKVGRAMGCCGGEGTLDFAAEGRRGRGSREFVLMSAARGTGNSILPESFTTDHTNLHGCRRLFRPGKRVVGHCGDNGTLDFAAEGRRGRGSRDFVLIRAARGIGNSILPESLTTDLTNLHGCPELVSFRQGKRAMGHCGDEGTLDFAAEGQRGRGSREFVLIRAARGIGGSILPESLTTDQTNLHECRRLKADVVSMTRFE